MDETYTGEVVPNGLPHVRRLPGLTITKYAVDPQMSNNCYLLECTATGLRVLIDAADDSASLLRLCDAQLTSVITTHQHWDHHRALAQVVSSPAASAPATPSPWATPSSR